MTKADIFNRLPIEIINIIFENIKIKDLRELKFICSGWSKIIREIINSRLDMKELYVINEKKINAININEIPDGVNENTYDYYSIFTNAYLYYTKSSYLLNKLMEDEEIVRFISKKIKADNKNENIRIRKMSHVEFIDYVEKSCSSKEMVWKILTNVTDSDALLEEDFLQFFMNNYELYKFYTGYTADYIESTLEYENHKELYESFDYLMAYGILMVYPDKKTFSLHYQHRGGHL